MAFTGFLQKILRRLTFELSRASIIQLIDNYTLPKNVHINGSKVSGKVLFGGHNRICNGVTIQAKSEIKIGRYTTISGPNTDIIASKNNVNIGAFCSIARNVAIQEFNHFTNRTTTFYILKNVFDQPTHDHDSKGSIEIGNDVWIGTQCVILSGAKIGDGVVVAANSVVSGVVPPYAIVGGSPARILKYRFDEELIQRLLKVEWWDWDIEKIKKNKAFFEGPLSHMHLDNII